MVALGNICYSVNKYTKKCTFFLSLQEKQKYEILTNTFKTADDVISIYCELCDRYPGLIAIMDGIRTPVSMILYFKFSLVLRNCSISVANRN